MPVGAVQRSSVSRQVLHGAGRGRAKKRRRVTGGGGEARGTGEVMK